MDKSEHSGSTALVCVDSYENSVPVGRLYHPDSGGETPFSCMVHLLHALDSLPEETGGPKSPLSRGALATFAVRVFFRQNASWQGSVAWLEQSREERFRSALELVKLMDSALRS